MAPHPQSINSIPASLCRSLEIIFSDLDDTMTTGGMLLAGSFQSLWKMHEAGLELVLVTGRPAGWCDHLARMWPVAAVIGENGAFCFSYNRTLKKMERFYLASESERQAAQKGLDIIKRRVLHEVPACKISADQAYRISDLAIDFCEDVPPLSKSDISRICRIIEQEKAQYKISSIHINCWFGDFDKVKGVKSYLKRTDGRKISQLEDKMLFTGDSPNDEPLFEELVHSIGMANIIPFLKDISHPPRYITEKAGALGFQEAAEIILKKRNSLSAL